MWAGLLSVRAHRASDGCGEDGASKWGRGVRGCAREVTGERGPRRRGTDSRVWEQATTQTGWVHGTESGRVRAGEELNPDRSVLASREREVGTHGGELGLMGRKAEQRRSCRLLCLFLLFRISNLFCFYFL
jgi:hypothetical protein